MFLQIHHIFDELKRRNLFLATAESLTGGLIAKYITDIPGASAVFWGGWVTYSVEAKQHILNVPAEVLDSFGVVSVETAAAMAKGALAIASDSSGRHGYALAVTGLAGPAGGTPQLPVGTVCIACAGNEHTSSVYSEKYLFSGTRDAIREQTYTAAMQMLLQQLNGIHHNQSSYDNPLDKIKNKKVE